ncbi:MAG TPA: 5-oxoprolinase subunit PxpA [Ktedonobacteraceae bacterium]|jgi:UPF0271 protein|nr:5-oxoprolinase subunit PxpA [Ktedonobacteraceae bacterium]
MTTQVKPYIDLNSDMGESYGVYNYGLDQEMMPFISSANVACGFHASDPHVMHQTVELAEHYGVRVGAHIGLPDRLGFGRRYIQLTPQELYEYSLYQLGALDAFLRAKHMPMSHVKMHGALYMMTAEQKELADAFVRAVAAFNPELEIYTLPNSQADLSATAANLTVIREFFADRPYVQGKIKMFGWTYAEIGTYADIRARVESLLNNPASKTIKTICVHSDTKNSSEIMRNVKESLVSLGYSVKN